MKYVLNDDYNGDVLVSQCGLIFKKEMVTEVPEAKSFEVDRYIEQKYIVPFKEEVAILKEEIKEAENKILEKTEQIEKPKGVSSVEQEEETLKPIVQESDVEKAKCPICNGTNVHYKDGCLDCNKPKEPVEPEPVKVEPVEPDPVKTEPVEPEKE